MSFKMSFSKRVFDARSCLGYTQEQLAEAVSTSPRWIKKIEKGNGVPGGELMVSLLIFLEIDANEFRKDVNLSVPVSNLRRKT